MKTESHLRDTWQAVLCYASIVGISVLHYATPTKFMWVHPVYARAYYVPLLLLSLFWGWRAGLVGACLATALYAPHVFHAWSGEHEEFMVSQLIEMATFLVGTCTAGLLADHERRQRKKVEDTAARLAQTNQQLQELFEQLRRAERLSALGELAAGLAHEIRNPLGSFEGAVDIVSRPELPEGTRQEFRRMALSEVDRLKGLVSNFLDFARPSASRPTQTSPFELLQSVGRLVSETAGLAHVLIHTRVEADLPEIMLDSQQIKQVLLNLALNSIQAMPGGGNVVLRASTRGEIVVFEVEDEGIGVGEEDMERIFDPFFTTRPDGTGLGLSIASRIVTQHGGCIRARKNPNRGMTFAIELPLQPACDECADRQMASAIWGNSAALSEAQASLAN